MNAMQVLGWALLQFLWQGTLIAAFYGAGRWWLRKSDPNSRYLLACAALAVMMAAPIVTLCRSRTGEPAPVPAGQHSAQVRGTALGGASESPARRQAKLAFHALQSRQPLTWIAWLWFGGAIVFSTRLAAGWMIGLRVQRKQVHAAPLEWQRKLDRLRVRFGIERPVRLLISSRVQAPAVVGWLRPVILAPLGALTGLPTDYVRALLAHELAHIRRHDYLVLVTQCIVESLLFYHPAVWWISGHMRVEREMCCDDLAVELTGDVVVYARALVEVATLRPSHEAFAMAANGGILTDRIARLLGRPRIVSRPVFDAGVLWSSMALAAAVALFGQGTGSPRFEVASIKPAPIKPGERTRLGMQSDPGRFTGSHVSVLDLIGKAYGVDVTRVSGGPSWLPIDRFDVLATIPPGTPKDKIPMLLQALLAERFKLVVRQEMKMTRVYALVADKGGPRLKPVDADAAFAQEGFPKVTAPLRMGPDGKLGFCCGQAKLQTNLERFADMLSVVTDRPVQDATGIAGVFDIALTWSPDNGGSASEDASSAPTGASIYTAVREQLGLRLEPRVSSLGYLVVEHVERPTEN